MPYAPTPFLDFGRATPDDPAFVRDDDEVTRLSGLPLYTVVE
jgi:hypothetical protein